MAEVQLVRVEVQVPKELCDIKDLLVGLAHDFKAGKKTQEIMFGSLPAFQRAFEGISEVSVELKSKEVYTLGAVLVAELLGIFLVPKAETVAALAAGAIGGVAAGSAAAAGVSAKA